MNSPEKVYETFLKKNLIISSTFEQISDRKLDPSGQKKCFRLSAFTAFGTFLQLVHLASVFLPENERRIVRNFTGDYLSVVGPSGIALTVILAYITISCGLDRICYKRTEERGFPAFRIIQTFRSKLSVKSMVEFEKQLMLVSRLGAAADVMFIHSTIALHAGIICYSVWLERNILYAILNVLSCITYMISLRNFIITFLASQTILLLATKYLVLRLKELSLRLSSVKSRIEIIQLLDELGNIKQTLHAFEEDVGWIISNSMIVFMPVIGFIISAGIASKDLLMRIFLLTVPSSFCVLFLISISTAAQVHTNFLCLNPVLARLQFSKVATLHEKLVINRYMKGIASMVRPFCFYICGMFPFKSTTIIHSLSLIISFILLLLPYLYQVE